MTLPKNLGVFAPNVDTSGKLNVTGLNTTGTPSASTVLKGDGSWSTVVGPTGPTGAASTVAGPTGPTGPAGSGSTFNYFGSVLVGSTTITPDYPNQTLNFAAGSNVTLTADNTTKTITIASSGGGGNTGLTWFSNSGPDNPITITGVTGIAGVSNQNVWVAIASNGTPSIAFVTLGGTIFNYAGTNGFGLNFYYASTNSIPSNANIVVTFNSGPSVLAMATYWVTTTNVSNGVNVIGMQTSAPSFYGSQAPGYPYGNKLFVTSSQVNMTTAMSTPTSWTLLGSATHTSYPSLTVIAFDGPATWALTGFSVANSGLSYNFAFSYNS